MNVKHLRRISTCGLAFGLALGLSACGEESSSPEDGGTTNVQTVAINTVCPVSDEDIDPKVTVDYEGATIAFCCSECKMEWDNADEAARAAFAAKARGAAEGAVPSAIPSGGEGGEQTGG